MILSKQKCCLLLTGVSTESKTYLCTLDKADFLAKRKCWTCTEICEALTFLMENIYMYVQFEGMVYQQIFTMVQCLLR